MNSQTGRHVNYLL